MPSSSTEGSPTTLTSTTTSSAGSPDYQQANVLPDPPPKGNEASETVAIPKVGLVTLTRAKDGSHVTTVNLQTISQDEIRERIKRILSE